MPIAGEFYAFGIDGQGISGKQLEIVKSRMESVKTKLEAKQFEGLTKEALIGDLLSAAALGYFAANDVNLTIFNRVGPALSYRQPSFGTFSTSLDPIYCFGIPQQVKMSGIMVDVDVLVNSSWAKNNDATLTKTVAQPLGLIASALEHRVPELFFTNEPNPGEAVSAVKALTRAAAQGQRIYQVTTANVKTVLPVLTISREVKDELRNSVAVGKVVTISQNQVTVGGWTGVGYIVSDPQTGSGAYRISGGSNGGILLMDAVSRTLLVFIFAVMATTSFSIIAVPVYGAMFALGMFYGITGLSLFLASFAMAKEDFPDGKAYTRSIAYIYLSTGIGMLFLNPLLGAFIALMVSIILATLDTYLINKLSQWRSYRRLFSVFIPLFEYHVVG